LDSKYPTASAKVAGVKSKYTIQQFNEHRKGGSPGPTETRQTSGNEASDGWREYSGIFAYFRENSSFIKNPTSNRVAENWTLNVTP
jgi:hypothetical protein